MARIRADLLYLVYLLWISIAGCRIMKNPVPDTPEHRPSISAPSDPRGSRDSACHVELRPYLETAMKNARLAIVIAATALLGSACSTNGMMGGKGGGGSGSTPATVSVPLSGAQEVPPVSTKASAASTITVAPNGAVAGVVTLNGIDATAAHIHEAPPGANGPVIVPLARSSNVTFTVPAGARLTEAQMASYKAGNLYVNVHSAAYPGGELRGQLKPQ